MWREAVHQTVEEAAEGHGDDEETAPERTSSHAESSLHCCGQTGCYT